MKLLSLNLEGKRHLETALPFIETYDADWIGLQEAPEDLTPWLENKGYYVTFAPMCIRDQDNKQFVDGIFLATKEPHSADVYYYYQPQLEMVKFKNGDARGTIAHPVIFGQTKNDFGAVTHFTWNPDGEIYDENQDRDLDKLLTFLAEKPQHFLFGDFNIPRHENVLYEKLIKTYADQVPKHHKSSLDRNLHRGRHRLPELNKLFDRFMVDYILTTGTYKAKNVEITFGISDHAALTGLITKK